MQLSDHCASLGRGRRGYSEFARRVGDDTKPERVRRWCLPEGHRDASLPKDRETFRRIFMASDGQVTPNDMIGLPPLHDRGGGT